MNHVVDRIAAAVGWAGSVSPELDWDTVERRLQTVLPSDYKQFMSRFPAGVLSDSVRIHNPVQSDAQLASFVDEFDLKLEVARLSRAEYDLYEVFPAPGGVIPFAADVAGGSFFWLPRTSDPDEWHVVYQSRDSPDDWTTTELSMTAVLLQLVTSQGTDNILGWEMTERSFEPF
ncbi:SMI1/KNR4 family protein [Kibdelosporangium aridum]|uniref:SMI1/KNR4 family protein n=1 Tax=Kibdelosporangium aridum TaxID=2030 RepID=A0A428ZCJ7_KIBAR|nr:SMI1/KNR4 family protein [Kibdelosporangium aridum]RSM85779.1 SMI1/KNR4 family protein [Kibdelosporangium aridum]